MDIDRIKHSYAVAIKMQEIGKKLKLNNEELNELFILGLNHDIGYQFTKNYIVHNKIGGVQLKKSNYKYWKEVFYHGELEPEYQSLYLDILNLSDMQIDKYGNDVGFDKRLKDIENRYGKESNVYEKCYKIINKLKKDYQLLI